MEDKLIREKLNGLDSLPEGYAPNLDSKWELLRAGQPEKKKRPVLYYFAAAASLLMLLVFGFFLNVKFAPKAGNSVATAVKTKPETKPVFPEISKTEVKNQIANTALTPEAKQPENAIKKPVKTKSIARASIKKHSIKSKPEVIALFPAAPERLVPEPETAAIAATNPEKPVKKRHRYVELDFEAPTMPQRLPQPVQTAQLQVKIRLMPQTSEAIRSTAPQENPIRLQHTF